MKKRFLLMALCICLLYIAGCYFQPQQAELNARRPMIMIEGQIYLCTGKETSENIDESDILGEILTKIASSEMPTKNNESNFSCIGAKYAPYENGIALNLEDRWFFFEPEKE